MGVQFAFLGIDSDIKLHHSADWACGDFNVAPEVTACGKSARPVLEQGFQSGPGNVK